MAAENSSKVDPDTGLPAEELEANEEEAPEVDPETGLPVKEEPSEVETLNKRLETSDKRLRDTQAKLTQTAQENSEFRGKLSVLDKPAGQEVAADPFASIDEEEAIADPMVIARAAQQANATMLTDVVGVLREFRTEMLGSIEKNNPERLALKTRIDELREDPDLADLDDGVLLKLAKRDQRTAPKPKEVERASGAPGGGSRARGSAPSADDIKKTSLYKEIYGDVLT